MAAKDGLLKMKAIECVGKSLKDSMYAPDNTSNHVAVVRKFKLKTDEAFLSKNFDLTM